MKQSGQISGRQFDWEEYLRQRSRRRVTSGILLLVSVVALLFVSTVLLRGRYYLLMGFGVVLLILVLFFGQYERRKPQAREVVLLSTLTALCVVMNEICAHTIPLHAGTTMVVICGIGLGPEAGFLIGAMSRLVCNFFDGQGPWTPWQMAAWGMVGYLSGMAFNKIERRRTGETLARRLSLEKGRRFRVVMGPVLCILSAWVLAYVVYLFRRSPGENFFGWRLYFYGLAGMAAGCILQRKKLPVDDITTTVFTFFCGVSAVWRCDELCGDADDEFDGSVIRTDQLGDPESIIPDRSTLRCSACRYGGVVYVPFRGQHFTKAGAYTREIWDYTVDKASGLEDQNDQEEMDEQPFGSRPGIYDRIWRRRDCKGSRRDRCRPDR